MNENLYADRDPEALGEHYMRHIDRMTVEGLHSKSAIAAELAHRDAEIAALRKAVQSVVDCDDNYRGRCVEQERMDYDTVVRQCREALQAQASKDAEQAAFETWLADKCPSGDVTEVQRQWEASYECKELQAAITGQNQPNLRRCDD